MGASANTVINGLDVLTDIVYDIEVTIARYALAEMRELYDRAMRSKGTRELQPQDAARIVNEVLEAAFRAIQRSVSSNLQNKDYDTMRVSQEAYKAGLVAAERW